jgi:hypothetical protein
MARGEVMAETFGSLCDKLIVVKLKAYHTKHDDKERLESLSTQEFQLRSELNEYVANAIVGNIPKESLTFQLHKVHTGVTIPVLPVVSIAGSFSTLVDVNCDIWHLQEKLYNFEKVPADKKNFIVRQISVSNVQRSNCIDALNMQFKEMLK